MRIEAIVGVVACYHRVRVFQGDLARKPFTARPESYTLRPGGTLHCLTRIIHTSSWWNSSLLDPNHTHFVLVELFTARPESYTLRPGGTLHCSTRIIHTSSWWNPLLLDPNHTHFVLVEDDKGTEDAFRTYCECLHVYS